MEVENTEGYVAELDVAKSGKGKRSLADADVAVFSSS